MTGGGNLTVTVVDPTAQYYDYVKTLDGRIAKAVRVGRMRFEPFMEIFNVLNFSTVSTVNETIGPSYYTPGIIVQGRRFQLGGRVDW